jgi:DNA-binding MarR family transcriptional regulator
LDRYVVDTLMRDLVGHDRTASAFLVYLYLDSHQPARGGLAASYAQLASATGLSKRAVQRAVAQLLARRLVEQVKSSATATPVYQVTRPWRRRRGA